MSLSRQNFSKAAEKALNNQINAELYASYVYRSMASYFNRDDIALPGFSKYFKKAYEEESDHAQMLTNYLSKRGGRLNLDQIEAPKQEWTTPLEALEDALALEKEVNDKLLTMHSIADAANDPQMCDYIEGNFLNEQVDAIKELADKITNLKRVGEGLGVYLFDKDL